MTAGLDTLLASAAETALNGLLRLQPELAEPLLPLENKAILLDLSNPDLKIYLLASGGNVRVLSDYNGEPEVSIRATPQALLRLARNADDSGAEQDIYIQGNMQTARALQALLADAGIDWEDLLGRCIGDLPAQQLGGLARTVSQRGRRTASQAARDLTEYLQYERGELPPPLGVERFINDVDQLRVEVDRLEVRVKRLQSRIVDP